MYEKEIDGEIDIAEEERLILEKVKKTAKQFKEGLSTIFPKAHFFIFDPSLDAESYYTSEDLEILINVKYTRLDRGFYPISQPFSLIFKTIREILKRGTSLS